MIKIKEWSRFLDILHFDYIQLMIFHFWFWTVETTRKLFAISISFTQFFTSIFNLYYLLILLHLNQRGPLVYLVAGSGTRRIALDTIHSTSIPGGFLHRFFLLVSQGYIIGIWNITDYTQLKKSRTWMTMNLFIPSGGLVNP